MVNKEVFADAVNALGTFHLPFDVAGAVAFGSRVKGSESPYSDFDLLVMAEGINPKLHRRTDEISRLKRSLPSQPLDILLLTSKEVVSNFENHNPLFLDIAEDGVVLLDKTGLLNTLIEKTRDYIKIKGIKRLEGGWQFPVKQGVATYLSSISNKDFAGAMLKDGERDFLIAKKLHDEGFYDKSVYHSQQSIEKCVKAVLIAFGIFQKTHFIGEILKKTLKEKELADDWKKKLGEVAEISEELEPAVSLSRYPGIIDNMLWLPFEQYEKSDAADAADKAEKVLSVTKEFFAYWFPDGSA